MLEELSLMKNKGSKMFRMRKARMEKFIYENNPDLFTSESMVKKNQRKCSNGVVKLFICTIHLFCNP